MFYDIFFFLQKTNLQYLNYADEDGDATATKRGKQQKATD